MDVIISGMTCSGKTTLSTKIKNHFKSATHVQQDWYFKDKKDIPVIKKGYLLDSPNAFHLDEFKIDTLTLLSVGKVLVPTYNIKENKRTSKNKEISKSKINIFEGLHTIESLKELRNSIRVFIETDLNECMKRRIERDLTYGIDPKEISRYFSEVVVPMYKTYIERQKSLADMIIRSEGDELCLLKKLQTYY